MNTTNWEVAYTAAPAALRHCKKCDSDTQHICSNLFRINAQQKRLDAWLIYRCGHCKTTWNLPILSRIGAKNIPANLLHRFTNNDAALAQQYAADTALLKKQGAILQPAPYTIAGPDISPPQDTLVTIACNVGIKIKLAKILCQKLSLSRSAFAALANRGLIQMANGADVQKAYLQKSAAVIVYAAALQAP